MLIRLAHSTDLKAITDIYNQGVKSRLATADEDEKTLENRTEWYAQFSDKHPLFVVEDNSQVIAYGAIFSISPKSGYRFAVEHSVYVDESHHGKGLGRMMLVHLIEQAKVRGFTFLEARIFKHNPISIKLHESLGFKLIGTMEKVANLDGNWCDVCIYVLDL